MSFGNVIRGVERNGFACIVVVVGTIPRRSHRKMSPRLRILDTASIA